MLDWLRSLWTLNPVRTASLLAAAVVAVATQLGVVVEETSVVDTLLLVVPILLGGQAARAKVTPWVGPVGEPSDDRLPSDMLPAEIP